MKYKLAIFDMDGTLLYTLDDLYNSFNVCLEKVGLPRVAKEKLRRYIGYTIEYVDDMIMPPDTPQSKKDEFLAEYKVYFAKHNADTTREFPGMTDMLKKLRAQGILTAVVSNNNSSAVQKLCDIHFPGLFDAVVGAEGLRAKPEPDTVFAVLEKLGIKGDDAVFIGDGETDIMAAINAGIDSIAVLWGYRDRDILLKAGAQTFVSTNEELISEILKN